MVDVNGSTRHATHPVVVVGRDGRKLTPGTKRNRRGRNLGGSSGIFLLIVGVLLLSFSIWRNRRSNDIFFQEGGRGGKLSEGAGTSRSSATPVVKCKYHGNCPIGTSCVKDDPNLSSSSSSSSRGECKPYQGQQIVRGSRSSSSSSSINNDKYHYYENCISQCYNELVNDEYYYFGSQKPVIYNAYKGLNGHGCIITYSRKHKLPNTPKPSYIASKTIEDWIQQRFHYIVRIDPAAIKFELGGIHDQQHNSHNHEILEEEETTYWNVLCDMPCQTDTDCQNEYNHVENDSNKMTCQTTQSNANRLGSRYNETLVQATKTCRPSYEQQQQQQQKDTSNTATTTRSSLRATNAAKGDDDYSSDNDNINDMVIVTGADSTYFTGLLNLISSIKYWAPKHKVVIYNLGMTKNQIKQLKNPKKVWSSNILKIHWIEEVEVNMEKGREEEEQDGDKSTSSSSIPTYYPDHVRNNLHNYAWKSIIINETVHEYKSIFWLDAGATIVNSILPIQDIIHQAGIFLVHGQDEDMKYLSHPNTYKSLLLNDGSNGNYDPKSNWPNRRPHYAGGIQGHVYPSKYIETIVIPNAKCALDESCISPAGSNLNNHRYDQTSLSILSYNSKVMVPHYTEYLAAGRDQLNDDLASKSDNSNNRMIIWTSRNTCDFYTNLYEEEEEG